MFEMYPTYLQRSFCQVVSQDEFTTMFMLRCMIFSLQDGNDIKMTVGINGIVFYNINYISDVSMQNSTTFSCSFSR